MLLVLSVGALVALGGNLLGGPDVMPARVVLDKGGELFFGDRSHFTAVSVDPADDQTDGVLSGLPNGPSPPDSRAFVQFDLNGIDLSAQTVSANVAVLFTSSLLQRLHLSESTQPSGPVPAVQVRISACSSNSRMFCRDGEIRSFPVTEVEAPTTSEGRIFWQPPTFPLTLRLNTGDPAEFPGDVYTLSARVEVTITPPIAVGGGNASFPGALPVAAALAKDGSLRNWNVRQLMYTGTSESPQVATLNLQIDRGLLGQWWGYGVALLPGLLTSIIVVAVAQERRRNDEYASMISALVGLVAIIVSIMMLRSAVVPPATVSGVTRWDIIIAVELLPIVFLVALFAAVRNGRPTKTLEKRRRRRATGGDASPTVTD